MKNLVMITSHFPFGTGEPFIESEMSVISGNFEKIIIISQDIKGAQTRSIPANSKIYRYNTSTDFQGFLNLPFLITGNFSVITRLYRDEVRFRKSVSFNLSLRQKLFLVRKILKALQLRDYIKKILDREIPGERSLLYSYWFKTGAHAIALLQKPGSVKIARAHGSDLYEESSPAGYIPLQKSAAEGLNALFFVSEHGKDYFEKKFGKISGKLLLSRLGAERSDDTTMPEYLPGEEFIIVSCSYLIALKRIDLLIRSLALTKAGGKIKWIHFGDGEMKGKLTALAAELLSPDNKIKWEFRGHVPNTEILDFYASGKVGLFINTSYSEGIPVSIMEAQSFGIPVIATDTGGVREIIAKGTGTLINVDFAPAELAGLIDHYAGLPDSEMEKIRRNAFNNWKKNFNARSNYLDFLNQLNSILETCNNSPEDK
ncbi:MAG: glycosyltransferase [Bacteroidales bacterium]|nr:glycosyltransferase [Bacteroidales bacterium]